MKLAHALFRHLMLTLMGLSLTLGATSPVMADVISSEQLAMETELQSKRDEIQAYLARDEIQDTLLAHGVAASDVEERVRNLSNAEVLQVHGQLADMPAGGNILGAALTIIVIFMLLDIAGATDIFPNI